jgi:DNA processing protein
MRDFSVYLHSTKLMALSRFGQVGPRLFDVLIRQFGDIDRVLAADTKTLSEVKGLTAAMARKIAGAAGHLDDAAAYVQSLLGRDIHITSRLDDDFPHRLYELNDPPLMLYCRGHLPAVDRKIVTLMGADLAGADSIAMTSRLAKMFAEAGVQVLASLDGGNAAAAHLAARTAGASSYALIDSGFDSLLGTDVMPLAIDVAVSGGVITEYLPETVASNETMSQSNRLLVGLANAVVFTELYKDSRRGLDMLEFCDQTGKLTFFMIDPDLGALSDEATLAKAVDCGAIMMTGYESVKDIIRSLV